MAATLDDLNSALTNLGNGITALSAEIAKVTPIPSPADFQTQVDAINAAIAAISAAVAKLQQSGF